MGASTAWRSSGLVVALLALSGVASCVPDTSAKTACRTNADCLGGRVCVAPRCTALSGPNAAAGSDAAPDKGSPGGAPGQPDGAPGQPDGSGGAGGLDGGAGAPPADAADVRDAADAGGDHTPGTAHPNYAFISSGTVVPQW